MTDIIKFSGQEHNDEDHEEDESWLGDLETMLDKFEDELDAMEEDEDFDEDDLEDGGDLANLDVPDEVLETVYAMGYEFYERHDYEKAASTFGLLCMLAPFETKFWKGLAATAHMSKDYENALGAYATAALLNPGDPMVSLNAAECCFATKDIERGLLALDAAEEIANDDKDKYAEVLSRVDVYRDAWGNNKKKNSTGKSNTVKSKNKKK